MKKYYKENYDSEQLKKIIKMEKILSDSYEEFLNKKSITNIVKKEEKIKEERIEEIIKNLDVLFNLTSIWPESKIRELIESCNGDEEKIILEIEKML